MSAPPTTQRHTNLPIATSSFIGRTQELAEIRVWLDTIRLLTLTGPGGCGKTRLARQAVGDSQAGFADGVVWCDLDSISDPAQVPVRLASELGLGEQAEVAIMDALTDAVASRQLLIVLDNCEHVLAACAALALTLLQKCPDVKLLATSLQALGLPNETVWLVPPLACPASEFQRPLTPVELERWTADIGQFDAVRLFIERARRVSPEFPLNAQNAEAVATICRRLDGIPLALELAAARVNVLSPARIAERLDDAFRLLTHGPTDHLPRHQTLRATMDWIYALLGTAEQLLLRRLSVFAGSFTVDAVESVTNDTVQATLDALTGLVDKSLVTIQSRDARGDASFRLLETVRQYAREKLEDSGESSEIRSRYLDWCVAWAVQAEPHLTQAEPGVWLKQFESHQEHFRAVLRWACTSRRVEQGLRLANALKSFWLTGGMAEGCAWLEELLNLETKLRQSGLAHVADNTRAWALLSSGRLAVRLGDDAHGAQRGEESLALFRAGDDPVGLITVLNLLALAAQDTGDYPRALALYVEALDLSRRTNNTRMTGVLLVNEGLMYYEQQDFRRAAPLWEEANAIAERLNYSSTLDNLACLAMMRGDLTRAQELLERELENDRGAGDKHGTALTLMDLGEVARRQSNLKRAQALLDDALERHQQMSNATRIGENLVYLAHVARNRGQILEARVLYEQSLPYLAKSNYTRYISQVQINLGVLESVQGRAEQAMPLLQQGLRSAQQGNHRLCRVEALEAIAALWAAQRKAKNAARILAVAAAEREQLDAPVPPVERQRYEHAVNELRATLGDDAYLTIQGDARGLTMEQVVAEILTAEGRPIAEDSQASASDFPPSPPDHLRVYALGPTRVLVGERTLAAGDWTYNKSKELLFYLLLNPPATKAQIGLDLWPDASPDQLRSIFHRALHYLRKALGHPEWVTHADGVYTAAQELNVWFDVREFETRLTSLQPVLQMGTLPPAERAPARQVLAEAIQLWRGDLLADVDVGEWAVIYREVLRRSHAQALMDLGQLYVSDARYAEAGEVYQRMLAADNYFEGAHRELMRCYARQGEAAHALRQYQSLRTLLATELGVEPSPETTLLYERMRRGDDV